jgi:hypothetical protein
MVSSSNHMRFRPSLVLRKAAHDKLSNMSFRTSNGWECVRSEEKTVEICKHIYLHGAKVFSPAPSQFPSRKQVRNDMVFCLFILILSAFPFAVHSQDKSPKPVIAEIILTGKNSFKTIPYFDNADTKLKNVMQWRNRVILYANTIDVESFKLKISKAYPKYQVIFFQNPFYDFERKYCSDKTVAAKWDNIILSANLVNDPKMQQEYLNYHAMQFQKWPEVSQGFCNADFQQLLVYKTGRQLMLVISIPHGKSLDELNPLTTKNNPRVNDWNNMMKKYQEGIEGTKKGEVWVFFKDITAEKLYRN